MIKLAGVHHPAFSTPDMDATIRFWRDLLGLRIAYTRGGPGDRQYFFALGEHDFVVFFEWPDVEPLPYRRHGEPKPGEAGIDHLAIRVPEESALWELMGKLDAAGFPASDVIDHGYGRSLFTYDPNGIPLEFINPAPHVPLGREPVLAEAEPSEIAREGAEPQPGHWPEAEQVPDEDRHIFQGAGYEDFTPRDDKAKASG